MAERPAVRVLAGDVGGTSTRLAVYEVAGGRPRELERAEWPSGDHGALGEILEQFLERAGDRPRRACLGLPGPVTGRRMRTTNLPWVVDADELEARHGLERVVLLNDLEAAAWGLDAVDASALVTLWEGRPDATGNRALIAAGTGLGEAGAVWTGRRHLPFACEGGHASFAPADAQQAALLELAWRELEHVSFERFVSGPGLVRVYRLELERSGRDAPDWFRAALESEAADAAAAVASAAEEGACDVARRAVELFVGLYGAEAGNLALKLMATGGVFVAGGIAPKLRWALERGGFVDAFLAKGRMRRLLEQMPVRLVTDGRLALLGAACRAAQTGTADPD